MWLLRLFILTIYILKHMLLNLFRFVDVDITQAPGRFTSKTKVKETARTFSNQIKLI